MLRYQKTHAGWPEKITNKRALHDVRIAIHSLRRHHVALGMSIMYGRAQTSHPHARLMVTLLCSELVITSTCDVEIMMQSRLTLRKAMTKCLVNLADVFYGMSNRF